MGELAVRMSWAILASVWRRKASLSKEILEEDWAKRSGQDALRSPLNALGIPSRLVSRRLTVKALDGAGSDGLRVVAACSGAPIASEPSGEPHLRASRENGKWLSSSLQIRSKTLATVQPNAQSDPSTNERATMERRSR